MNSREAGMVNELKDLLMSAPDAHVDAALKQLVVMWDDPPSALQLLKTLDSAIFASLASGVAVVAMQCAYDEALKREGTTHERLVESATWREKL